MSKKEELKDKNFIVETYKAKNCKDVNIYFYADKTVAIKDCVDHHNIIYIDADIMNKVIKGMKELGWNNE